MRTLLFARLPSGKKWFIGWFAFVATCILLGNALQASTIQTVGAGSAVTSVDRVANFSSLTVATNGTPLSDYNEAGLFVRVDGDSWVGTNDPPLFDPFHGANGSDHDFHFPFGGSQGWVTIETTDVVNMYALEFMYGNGWTTGDINGVPWGNSNAYVEWQTWKSGSMVSSGTIGISPILEMGTIVGFSDPAGFDQLLMRCLISTSSDPTLQALALDNLQVQITPIPEPSALVLLLFGAAGLLVAAKRRFGSR